MPGIDFRCVREQISMTVVLQTLNWSRSTTTGSKERGPCPIHKSTNERSRSFSVDRAGNRFKCFGCGRGGNQLDLYCLVKGLDLYQGALSLCREVGVCPPYIED